VRLYSSTAVRRAPVSVNVRRPMNAHTENEGWIVERGGDVVDKKAQAGEANLSSWERLVYCLWVTDYMMRNAGDFANAIDLYPSFQSDAKDLSRKLSLIVTHEAFSLPQADLQRQYFDRFEAICDEIKQAAQQHTNDAC
jgi:hypothetical protein